MSYSVTGFDTVIDRLPIGSGHKVLTYHVVFLPDDLVPHCPLTAILNLELLAS